MMGWKDDRRKDEGIQGWRIGGVHGEWMSE